ncbi:MAG: mechanosensitive ion channel family protein [Spirulinaceae cyanobacterium SM2_1_0]|nr:mechanosensitive ion channel family protein [Spirulinaceae cyanobacterium SM2_1_0]
MVPYLLKFKLAVRSLAWRSRRWFSFWLTFALVLALWLTPSLPGFVPAQAQTSLTQQLTDSLPQIFAGDRPEMPPASGWVYLDGNALFRIAAGAEDLPQRQQEIEQNLRQAAREFISSERESPNVEIRESQSLPTLYANDQYILTVTHLDAALHQAEPSVRAETVKNALVTALVDARQERQPERLRQRGLQALGLLAIATLASMLLRQLQRRWQRRRQPVEPAQAAPERINLSQPMPEQESAAGSGLSGSATSRIATNLTQRQRDNVRAVRRLLFQLLQASIWLATSLTLLSLFPQTRPVQVWLLARMQSYAIAVVIAIATYIAIRLSYVLVDRLIEAVLESAQLVRRGPRLQQRVSTVSGVAKGMATVLLIVAGSFGALGSLGTNLGPLLTGAGLVGVAISLASQNIIRDAINGFLILAEDQYAVGDVIVVGEVSGLVERITLRMTQLRDPEERLITIPNSKIEVVCNLTSHHSQADLQIPVAYSADVDQAFAVVQAICDQMKTEPGWRELISQEPNILGLDDFSDRGMVIRVWIRTPPLKHWDVAREFRRRIKRAFDAAGIPLARQQQELWVRPGESDRPLVAEWSDHANHNH